MGTRYGQLDAAQAADLGYLPAKVLLDGKEIRNVSVINDIEGWIEVYKTDKDGHIIAYDGLNDPHTETFRMYGDVVYIPKEQDWRV